MGVYYHQADKTFGKEFSFAPGKLTERKVIIPIGTGGYMKKAKKVIYGTAIHYTPK